MLDLTTTEILFLGATCNITKIEKLNTKDFKIEAQAPLYDNKGEKIGEAFINIPCVTKDGMIKKCSKYDYLKKCK